MSRPELRLDELVGREVRDAEGRRIGRLFELEAVIELREHGNEYVVTTFHVGSFGAFEWLAASHFARHALLLLGRFAAHRSYSIPWQSMDLTDPSHPRVTTALRELVPVAR